jgi:hypothetical protein
LFARQIIEKQMDYEFTPPGFSRKNMAKSLEFQEAQEA